MDLARVRETLKNRVVEVCQMLLPAGREDRGLWRCGDAKNTPGNSLCVHLQGPMQGLWTDFAESENSEMRGGDLLKLWMVSKGVNFRTALEQAGRAFNIPDEEQGWDRKGGREPAPARAMTQADLLARLRAPAQGGRVWKWLTETRKIPQDVIARYRIGEYRGKWRDGKEHDFVVFPFFDEHGKVALLKYRDVDEKKNMWTWPRLADGGKVILFGLQGLRNEGDAEWPKDLCVTEGELDAMALAAYGYFAVSLPFGAQGKLAAQTGDGDGAAHVSRSHEKWLENMHEWLQGFETIYLSGDSDKAGQAAWIGIPQRLGEYRIRHVTWPDGHKDANECLQFGVTAKAIHRALRDAKHCDPDALVRPEQKREEIRLVYWPTEDKLGDELPWTFPIRFRPAETTIWHGLSGSGKTQVLNNCLAWWAWKYDRRSCIASLEWPTAETFAFLGRIALGRRRPKDEAEFNEVMDWLQQKFVAYYRFEESPLEDILRIWAYAARKYGCFHFVLDALLRVKGADVKDLDAARQILNKLVGFAQENRVHVHMVAHSKKLDSKHDPKKCWPTKYDISGSSDIHNLAHNVICVWRNTGKEEALFEAQYLPDQDPEKEKAVKYWTQREDTLLAVQKQRMTGREGHKRLWFDKDECGGSFQFREMRLGLDGQVPWPKRLIGTMADVGGELA